MLVMLLLAAGTYWLVQRDSLVTNQPSDRPKQHVPDYTLDQFSITTLSLQGQTHYRINAEKMVRYEDDETTEITLPAMRIYEPGKPEITVHANTGLMNADASVLDLLGDAQISRPASRDNHALRASSNFFRVLLNEDIIRTDQAITLQQGPSVMTAQGMIFNNINRQVQLLGHVRGQIHSGNTTPQAHATVP